MTARKATETVLRFTAGRIDAWVKDSPDVDPLPYPVHVHSCVTCGALVPDQQRRRHDGWHRVSEVQR